MPTYRAQVVLPFFTNMPSDVITNTFHFFAAAATPLATVADDVNPHLTTFYDDAYDTGMANYVNYSLAHVNWYALADPPPRTPYTLPLNLPVSVQGFASTLPTEVAAVLSFQADPLSGSPQARRRGRVYLGALSNTAMTASSSTQFPRFNTAALGDFDQAGTNLIANTAAAEATWAVWSPTDQTSRIVTNGWIDESPDTQRRRSVDPTLRQLFP